MYRGTKDDTPVNQHLLQEKIKMMERTGHLNNKVSMTQIVQGRIWSATAKVVCEERKRQNS